MIEATTQVKPGKGNMESNPLWVRAKKTKNTLFDRARLPEGPDTLKVKILCRAAIRLRVKLEQSRKCWHC